jgi:hypothetical protein
MWTIRSKALPVTFETGDNDVAVACAAAICVESGRIAEMDGLGAYVAADADSRAARRRIDTTWYCMMVDGGWLMRDVPTPKCPSKSRLR